MEIICPHCNSIIENDSEFCPFCMEELNSENFSHESEKNICPICGNENDIQSTKCNFCCSVI